MSVQNTKTCSVIGSGPNGLAAAIKMARAGYQVTVHEAQADYGGGCRSLADTPLPGFLADHCSAIHPLGIGSPYFRTLELERYGLEWVQPDAAVAHPLDDGTAAVLHRSVAATAYTLGEDANAYARLMGPLVPSDWNALCDALLRPLSVARYPLALARFGLPALLPAQALANAYFRGPHARALLAGLAAHSFLPLDQAPSAAFSLALAVMGHAVGWPMPRGGSQRITDALVAVLKEAGGRITCESRIDSLDDLPPISDSHVVMADVGAKSLLRIAEDLLPRGYKRSLEDFELGPGIFKVDYALDSPIPWRAKECALAGTVHLGGTFEEIANSEAAVARGEHSEQAYVLLAQQSLFDPSRAPAGKHTAWAYCHVPRGSNRDMSAVIDSQIERFAPGFTQRILAQVSTSPQEFERDNANFPGGDISGGAYALDQMLLRPAIQPNPWSTGVTGLSLCSAATPPGGGVHGMCGYYAAQSVLGELWRG